MDGGIVGKRGGVQVCGCGRSMGCGIVEWPYEEVHNSQEQRQHMLQMVDHVVEYVKVSVQVVSVGCPASTARCSLGRP